MLELIQMNESLKDETLSYKHEFIQNNERIHGGAGLGDFSSFEEWLAALRDNSSAMTVRPNRVVASTYFARRTEDSRLVGIIDIRHTLDDKLADVGGHIGYSIRKSERRKGYAKEMLGLALEKCRELKILEVLITCDKENHASARTIIANGGTFQDEVMDEGVIMHRYWINLT